MSNFPGDLFAYNNPLISIYNPHTQSLTPEVPHGSLVPWVSKTKTFGITLSARLQAFHVIKEALSKHLLHQYIYEGEWNFHSPAQLDFKFFVGRYESKPYHSVEEGTRLKISSDFAVINDFFRKHGSLARMDYFDPMEGYGVGVLSTMTYGWQSVGLPTLINDTFRGFEMTNGYEILESQDNFHLPLIRIQTNNPNIKAVIKMANPQYNPENPYKLIFNFLNFRRWRHFYRKITKEYNSLKVPHIKTEISEDVGHLNGMCLNKYNKKTGLFQSATIARTQQQTLINIDDYGVNIGSTFKVNNLIVPKERFNGYTRPPFVVDKPFLFWLEDDWVPSYPLFIGFFNRDAWVKL
jgi:hypothetical protein